MESKVLQTTDSLFLVSPRGLKFFLAVHDTPALSAYSAEPRLGLVQLDSTADNHFVRIMWPARTSQASFSCTCRLQGRTNKC